MKDNDERCICGYHIDRGSGYYIGKRVRCFGCGRTLLRHHPETGKEFLEGYSLGKKKFFKVIAWGRKK